MRLRLQSFRLERRPLDRIGKTSSKHSRTMNKELISSLEIAVRYLTDQNWDGSRERNDVGWSSRDSRTGKSLSEQIGRWTPAQSALAWKLCSVYRHTQLAHLNIPQYTEEEASKHREASINQSAEEASIVANASNFYGLNLSQMEIAKTKEGPKYVQSARPLNSHPFWAVWRRDKEAMKAAGWQVKKDHREQWEVKLWTPINKPSSNKPTEQTSVQVVQSHPPITDTVCTDGLLPYQIPSVQRLVNSLRKYRAALDASDVGTGKTYSALAACRELKLKPLVVCPKAVIPSWKKAARHFGIEIEAINYELVRRGTTEYGVMEEGYRGSNQFRWTLTSCNALIFDEVHRCKGEKTDNSKLVIAAKSQDIPVLALSATAAVDPTEMKALGYLLGFFDRPSSFWGWALTQGCDKGRHGGIEFKGNAKHLAAIHSMIFPHKGTRIRISELGDAFPETMITVQNLELNGATKKINDAYEAAMQAIQEVREKQTTDSINQLTTLLRARQISEAEKIPAIVEQIQDAYEQGMSVAVFLNFNGSINAILKSLGDKCGKVWSIHGQQNAFEREDAIQAFQSDNCRVILCNIQAGGVGISLHDVTGKHPRLALISPSWSAVDMVQTLGRVCRAGGQSKSIQRILYAAGTVEERVAAVVESKIARLDALNDGDLDLSKQ